MRTSIPVRAALSVTVPLVAGVVFVAWALVATLGGVPGCAGVPYEDGVDSWAAVGVSTALLYCAIGAAILAVRLAGWLALLATALTVLAVALGAQFGFAVGMFVAECEWDEGPALTLSLFATPSALFGYAIGWVLRRAQV